MTTKPIIIDFEGVDCSFKETNSRKLAEYIGAGVARRYAFPAYNKDSSYFVRQILNGKYQENRMVALTSYMLDMYDVWNTEIRLDILNGIKYVIFDRFWYSNLFYRARNQAEAEEVIRMASNFELPNADLIIKLVPRKQVMLDILAKKQNKDILELDEKFISDTYDRFIKCEFPEPTETIFTTNDTEPYERDYIFRKVLGSLSNIYGRK